MLKYTLVQYLFQGNEHAVDVILPHGNAKQKKPYHHILASTRDALKNHLQKKHPNRCLIKFIALWEMSQKHAVLESYQEVRRICTTRDFRQNGSHWGITEWGKLTESRLLSRKQNVRKKYLVTQPSSGSAESIPIFLSFLRPIDSLKILSDSVPIRMTFASLGLIQLSTYSKRTLVWP